MSTLSHPELKNQLLLALYDRAIKGKSDRRASATSLKRALQLEVSSQHICVLLDSLVDEGYLRLHEPGEKYAISEAGMALVESDWRFANTERLIVDHWNEPDATAPVSQVKLATIRFHLGQCVKLMVESDLSQSEKAQVLGLIKICEDIVDLPTPKLGLLKRILGWLKEVKDLLPLIEAISKLIR
ncbi:hypothetical protein IC614_03935 [Allosphingosinicella flava]|uniref:Uncharacterized protein n=1 Tax=Allosphingosinicella flava TaxID=2771430 RepID=A0A7T2LMM9_9SPHN|nr:hypothetical protein [Sphingosinicella flava]QPQ55749.1 hypothetical protein IC614_03935 [Sphingosinicella flava]